MIKRRPHLGQLTLALFAGCCPAWLGCGDGATSPTDPGALEVAGGPALADDVPALVAGSLAQDLHAEPAAQMSLIESLPSPPTKGFNTFRVRFSELDGDAYQPASVYAAPWMPLHGHGTAIKPTISPSETPGEWLIENLNLFMGGEWKVYVFVCDDIEDRCCDAEARPCSESSPSLHDASYFTTWIGD